MKLVERSYNGRFSRPRPEIFIEEQSGLLIIATPWGSRNAARKAIQAITEFFLAAKDDIEVTSPFQKLTCLSSIANSLRTAVMLANDLVYQEENRDEYLSSLELFAAAVSANELSFVQLGHPQVFLDRNGYPPITSGSLADLSLDFSRNGNVLPPLPSALLGVHSTSALNIRTIRVNKEDRLLLVSHSFMPSSFFNLGFEERSIEKISSIISKQSPQEPFWVGQVTF
ncbi:MAG: hypothetical protein IPK68_06600 [Bdellovibrionales bacterium]|nr:hypothetical protein [Bdellovibrionales bacterium]